MCLIRERIKVSNPVPLEVSKARRDCCRECVHATRSDDPKFASFNGLTTSSICLRLKAKEHNKPANIAIGTQMPDARCPLGLYGPVTVEGEQIEPALTAARSTIEGV